MGCGLEGIAIWAASGVLYLLCVKWTRKTGYPRCKWAPSSRRRPGPPYSSGMPAKGSQLRSRYTEGGPGLRRDDGAHLQRG
jgi:hypothetical protein